MIHCFIVVVTEQHMIFSENVDLHVRTLKSFTRSLVPKFVILFLEQKVLMKISVGGADELGINGA